MLCTWFQQRREKRYQQGCRDRMYGVRPQMDDAAYLMGYLSNRPEGLDEVVQHFSTVEDYLTWRQNTLKSRYP
ncbi:hypothetical protein ACQ4M4_18330 [Leptolyngbya sp. AN02str]|uniref:hypothetical protein n=1 Tax=Leptolyngbya sp. AN02str TaxID=3423363 RepID=UPI003D316EEB